MKQTPGDSSEACMSVKRKGGGGTVMAYIDPDDPVAIVSIKNGHTIKICQEYPCSNAFIIK